MGDVIKPRKARWRQDARGRWLRQEEGTGRFVHDFTVALYKRWRKPLRQWLSMRVGSRLKTVDLDDLAQEVFVRLLKYSNEEEIDNPQGYMFMIASNVANEWMERAPNRKEHLDIADTEAISYFEQLIENADPEAIAKEIDETNAIWAAIQQLPTRQRRILLRHIRDGKTYKQIAVERGITYRTILRDLTNAYAHLRTIMKRSDFDGY